MSGVYELRIVSRSDVSPAANRERGFHTPVQPYLPGGAIRGSLAALWKARYGTPDERFERQVAGLRIGPGIVRGASQRPLSVFACKYPITAKCSQTFDAAFEAVPDHRVCPGCGKGLEASKGQWEQAPQIRRVTRTALEDDQTVLQGSLFSRDALASGQTFRATALGELDWLGSGAVRVRIGGRRTTGGLVELTATKSRDALAVSMPDAHRLVLRMLAPAVFVDDAGRTQLVPQTGDLARALDRSGPAADVRVEDGWYRPETVGGWNAAAGLPKSTEVAVAGGSTYVLRSATPFTAAEATALVQSGLGLRRGDGLGWLEVATSAWQSAARAGTGVGSRQAADQAVAAMADRIDRLSNSREERSILRRQISGWLREGYTNQSLPPGAAFDGLFLGTQVVVKEALALKDIQRRALLIVLQAREWRDRNVGWTEGIQGRSK